MFLEGILSISGQAGLFKTITKGKTNIIVESLLTKKRIPIFEVSKISSVQEVSICIEGGTISIREVFISLFNKYEGKPILSDKPSNKELLDLFIEILPNYDKEKVYASDIKKIINWYNLLIVNDLLIASNIKQEENTENIIDEDKTE